MGKEKFAALLEMIVPQILQEIKKQNQKLEIDDINKFYSSRLYRELEDEETKLWHYSPLTLKNMYYEELQNGCFEYPEEA